MATPNDFGQDHNQDRHTRWSSQTMVAHPSDYDDDPTVLASDSWEDRLRIADRRTLVWGLAVVGAAIVIAFAVLVSIILVVTLAT